jgi:hypothetical protein
MRFTQSMLLLASCGLTAGAAAQGTIEYCFAVADSHNGDGVIEPGEWASLTLIATMDPDQPDGGFAATIFDILGVSNWDTGTISYNGNGALQANNDILGIEALQLPEMFNPQFDDSNPIAIYQFQWTPDNYTARWVEFTDANHIVNDVYTDPFGTSVAYEPESCGLGRFRVVPPPGTLAMLGLGGLLSARRRR